MTNCNENRPGYKQTKGGWIPEDWECIPLGKALTFHSGGTPSKANKAYWGGAIPWITAKDLKTPVLCSSQESVTLLGAENGTRLMPANTLFILVRGMTLLKDVPVALSSCPMTFNQDIKALEPKNGFGGRFFLYLLSARKQQLRGLVDQAGHGTGRLPTDRLSSIPVPIPPLAEQERIAEVLSAWDRAIALTGRLIEAKQRRKKGLMQQLLTGRCRFPEFGKTARKPGEMPKGWSVKLVSRIAQVSFSGVDKKTHADEMPVMLCNYMDVYRNDYITSELNFMQATASALEIASFSLRRGDVMITKDSETPDDIGVAAVVTEDLQNVLCGYHLALIRPKPEQADPIFLAKELGSTRATRHFSTHANGATRFGLSTAAVMKTTVNLPPIDEQKRIAAVLYACDREIQLLVQKHDNLQEQKRGLMQKLLTGEVRVKSLCEVTCND